MKTLTVLIGAPGSGKTTYAVESKDNPKVIHLSSDNIRFSKHDEGIVLSHNEVFETMHQELRKHAKDENVSEVIYDATNLSAKKRLQLYKTFHKSYSIRTIYFLEPIETLQSRLNKRNTQHLLDGNSHLIVPQHAIVDLLRAFTPDTLDTMKKYDIKSRLVNTHKINLQEIHNNAYSISHNSPHHLESVGEHIHRANNQIYNRNHPTPFGTVVRMHDLGKVYTGNGYGNFYGHANVSAYLYLTYEAGRTPKIGQYTFSTCDSITNHMNRNYPILGSMELRRQFDEIDNNARTSLPEGSFEFKIEKLPNGLVKQKFNLSVEHWNWDESLFSDEYFESLDSLLQRRSEIIVRNYKGFVQKLSNGIPKCFNIGELDSLPESKFKTKYNSPQAAPEYCTFYEKLDGSMIQIYKDYFSENFSINSRGTITENDYTRLAEEAYFDYYLFTEDTPYGVFELTGNDNRHIVEYPYDLKLTLLRDSDGNPNKDLIIPHNEVDTYLSQHNVEGLICYCPINDCYYKMKTEEYCNLHKVLSNYSPKKLAKYLSSNEEHDSYSLDDVFAYLPNHVKQDIQGIHKLIYQAIEDFEEHSYNINHNRKEFALNYCKHWWFMYIKIFDGKTLDKERLFEYRYVKKVCEYWEEGKKI